ncbi:DNA helicase [Actinidia chinensis var. chinensis]|uniref:DNA helicase n=1 Tax=Actinidia chinensis var. chinensis TaxID=1590841 RepID=A0A2R6PSU3_ACTCC|nr:DNA helicase [Actinidia chinensis var. chinensis]
MEDGILCTNRLVPFNFPVTGSKVPIWKTLWRKMKRERKKLFDLHSTTTVSFTYDPHSYAQNFDEGFLVSEDADDLSRSFSARFAVPSRVFEKSGDLMD